MGSCTFVGWITVISSGTVSFTAFSLCRAVEFSMHWHWGRYQLSMISSNHSENHMRVGRPIVAAYRRDSMPWGLSHVLKTACETQQCAAGSPHDEGKSAPASPDHQPAVSGSHMTPDLNCVLPFCCSYLVLCRRTSAPASPDHEAAVSGPHITQELSNVLPFCCSYLVLCGRTSAPASPDHEAAVSGLHMTPQLNCFVAHVWCGEGP